jgi:hypothetical protein
MLKLDDPPVHLLRLLAQDICFVGKLLYVSKHMFQQSFQFLILHLAWLAPECLLPTILSFSMLIVARANGRSQRLGGKKG